MFAFSDNDADAAQHRPPYKGNLGALDRYIDVALRLMSPGSCVLRIRIENRYRPQRLGDSIFAVIRWSMPKCESFPIAQIYVPTKRRGAARADVIREIAESMLEIGQQTPILFRRDGDRFILVEGLHRLEACKALGEETILGFLVEGRVGPQQTTLPHEPEADALQQKMARLRELRLAQEAVQQHSVIPTRDLEQGPKKSKGQVARPKKVSLMEWLAEREFDGGRRKGIGAPASSLSARGGFGQLLGVGDLHEQHQHFGLVS